LDFRPLDRHWWNADSSSQDLRWHWRGKRRPFPSWLRRRRPQTLRCFSASSSRRGRDVRLQYLGHHANIGGTTNDRALDRLAESRGKSCRPPCAGSDRIRRRLHWTLLRGLRDHGGRRTARGSFLYLCCRPSEGDRLGELTIERERGKCFFLR